MEKFNSQLKEFCQLTIQLIDIRNQTLSETKPSQFEKENELFEKTLTLIRKITKEVEEVNINSKNINDVQRIYSFLSQFSGTNFLFNLAIKDKLEQLNLEIKNQNQNTEKVNELKIEIDKINEKRMNGKNWWFDYSN
ncbi:hypothetical protein [Flavobacterium psychrophilum]|uniref:hypothetical protein n=1 Tax=Flavobacterium psychrophilum TaxID=96345 RepID=UPI001D08862C|nr:hypothetical protein [Flavobacterium psychrophilum]MCB6089465.1 hypothetical protein [Flavobacterium psychrophilum]